MRYVCDVQMKWNGRQKRKETASRVRSNKVTLKKFVFSSTGVRY